MEIFRRAIAPERRQAGSSSSPAASATSTGSTSASPAATPSSDSASLTSGTTSSTGSATASSFSKISDPGGYTDIFIPPVWTATETAAYLAPGVNASIHTLNTSIFTNTASAAAAELTGPSAPQNQLTACQINGTLPNGTKSDNGPFCTPLKNQGLWVDYTYAISWNPLLFSTNATNAVDLIYTEDPKDVVWTSPAVHNYAGYVDVVIKKDWLRGSPGNDTTSGQNVSVALRTKNAGDGDFTVKAGPDISLIVDPKTLPRIPLPKISPKYGLEIGLPIGLTAAIIVVLAIWCGMRKHDRHWSDIRGHGKDYMARRMRKRRRIESEIRLDDYGTGSLGSDQYTDQPVRGGNAFRDEVAKQRHEDDSSIRRFPTSF